jgi:DNA-binding response OmpR family regulator
MNKKKILIIEDEKDLKFLLSQSLAEEGYKVEEAIDGEEGLRKLKTGLKPDIILLDLLLPGMDGYEFLTTIKKDSQLSSIPVLVISNLGQREEIDKAKDLGAIDYLIKAHFTLDEILKRIEKFIA